MNPPVVSVASTAGLIPSAARSPSVSVKVILYSAPVSALAMVSFAVLGVSAILEAPTGSSVIVLIAFATAVSTSSFVDPASMSTLTAWFSPSTEMAKVCVPAQVVLRLVPSLSKRSDTTVCAWAS